MSTLLLNLDPELIVALRQGNQPADKEAVELITLELYRRGTISSGKAADVLHMERFEFIRHAARLGIPFLDMTPDEWQEELISSKSL